MEEPTFYSMKLVARRAGLTPHAIRVWERRYGAISPARTATNRRSYSEEDLKRLVILGKATRAGYSIGQIAHLSNDRLEALVREEEREGALGVIPAGGDYQSGDAKIPMDQVIAAAQSLDAAELEGLLTRAAVTLSLPVLLDQLIVPLMVSLGEMWREGHLRAAQEHLASSMVRTILGDLLRGTEVALTAPAIVVVTPAGQLHEIGALMAAATAASEGWKVIYLGTNLPAEEIAGAAAQARARAVALSIVHPSDDPRLPAEIEKLRRYLSDGVAVLVGGRSAAQYVDTLRAIGAVLIPDLPSFRAELERLRTGQTLHRQE